MIGDIAFTKSVSKRGRLNVAGQRLVAADLSTAAYTHVALMLGTYRAVHAMPAPAHVELTLIYELFSPGITWAVWRNDALADSVRKHTSFQYRLLWEAETYVGQRYNNPIRRRPKRHHSYCSELIGRVYSRAGYPFAEPPAKTLPLTIMKAIQAAPSAWRDVTREYQVLLAKDFRFQRLHGVPNLPSSEEARRAFLKAKRHINTSLPLFTEPMASIERFGRFDVERLAHGLSLWTPREMPGAGVVDEWVMLLMHDEVDNGMIALFEELGRTGRNPRGPPSR